MIITQIETSRLVLRDWLPQDTKPFSDLNSDSEVMRYFPKKLTQEESEQFIKRIQDHWHTYSFGLWAAEVKSTNEFIGFIGLATATFEASFTPCIEIGWRLDKKFWRKGYASEGANKVLEYGFKNLKLPEIFSFTSQLNVPSMKVMEKIGMIRDFNLDFDHPKVELDNPLRRHVLYRIKRDNWQSL